MTEKKIGLMNSIEGDIKSKHNSYSTKKMNNMMDIFLKMYHNINPNDESKKKVREFFSI